MNKSVLLLFLCSLVSVSVASYSATVALDLLYLSYAAYCPTTQLSSWNCHFCGSFSSATGSHLTVTTYVSSSSNIFGFIGYSGTTAYVVFRGTEVQSIENWAEDIDTFYTPYSVPSSFGTGEVHVGFYNSWLAVKSEVQAGVAALLAEKTITQVYFTGHSLGAAITMLAALEVGTTLNKPLTVYNYGQPRVGNKAFAHYWDSKIPNSFRVVNYNDMVPHLPFESFGFWHTTTEVWYTSNTNYKVCDSTGEDPTCMDSLAYVWDWTITDHLTYFGKDLIDGLCL